MSTRVKGQDTFVSVIVDGQLDTSIETVKSCDLEFEMDLLEENYLGEVATQYDTIYNGIMVKLELHVTRGEIFDLADAIKLRAQRKTGGATRIDITTSFWMPNGSFITIVLVDWFSESVPVSTGAREEYTSVTLSGKSSGYQIIK